MRTCFILVVPCALLIGACSTEPQQSSAGQQVRFATYNLALNRPTAAGLPGELGNRSSTQLRAITGIIQSVRPDVLVLNEFDYSGSDKALTQFAEEWLGRDGERTPKIDYPHRFTAPVNTGVPSGHDLDHDGILGSPGDGFGYGAFPGQYGMALLSRYPILTDKVRTFRTFLWRDMPGAMIPKDHYTAAEIAIFRLSSKSHWDIPVQIGDVIVHLLLCHPTPPVFDGPEDRNGRRNHDEIRFFADYVDPARSAYITDDRGVAGGLAADTHFVICGDMNADPMDGASTNNAIEQLLTHPLLLKDAPPASLGGEAMTREQAGINASHRGPARADTGDFNDKSVGNLRLDYVLPSRTLEFAVLGTSGVYWPLPGSDESLRWIGAGYPPISSDHRLVWVDVMAGL